MESSASAGAAAMRAAFAKAAGKEEPAVVVAEAAVSTQEQEQVQVQEKPAPARDEMRSLFAKMASKKQDEESSETSVDASATTVGGDEGSSAAGTVSTESATAQDAAVSEDWVMVSQDEVAGESATPAADADATEEQSEEQVEEDAEQEEAEQVESPFAQRTEESLQHHDEKSFKALLCPADQPRRRYNFETMMSLREAAVCKAPVVDHLSVTSDHYTNYLLPNVDYNSKRHRNNRGFERSQFGRGNSRRQNRRNNNTSIRRRPAVPVPRSENAWRPGLMTEENAALRRQVRSLLNKMSLTNYTKLSSKFIETVSQEVDNAGKLFDVVSLLFERTCDDHGSVGLFALLSQQVTDTIGDKTFDVEREDGTLCTLMWKSLVVRMCVMRVRHFEPPAQPESMPEDEYSELVHKHKHRAQGNILFLAQLFEHDLVSESIVHTVMQSLLKKDAVDESDVEAAALLLRGAGKKMDSSKSHKLVCAYVDRLSFYASPEYPPADIDAQKLSMRTRTKVADATDLFFNKWVDTSPHAKVTKAKTIDEFRQDYEKSKREKEEAKSHRGGGGGRSSRDRRGDRTPRERRSTPRSSSRVERRGGRSQRRTQAESADDLMHRRKLLAQKRKEQQQKQKEALKPVNRFSFFVDDEPDTPEQAPQEAKTPVQEMQLDETPQPQSQETSAAAKQPEEQAAAEKPELSAEEREAVLKRLPLEVLEMVSNNMEDSELRASLASIVPVITLHELALVMLDFFMSSLNKAVRIGDHAMVESTVEAVVKALPQEVSHVGVDEAKESLKKFVIDKPDFHFDIANFGLVLGMVLLRVCGAEALQQHTTELATELSATSEGLMQPRVFTLPFAEVLLRGEPSDAAAVAAAVPDADALKCKERDCPLLYALLLEAERVKPPMQRGSR